MTNDEIIKEEIDSILVDIIAAYERSGKKVSNEFPEGLEAVYEPNKGTIKGYVYLAGREAGKMPPISAIKEWVQNKGIFGVLKEYEASSLAYVIAKKIGEKGTAEQYELKIYEEVITDERIDRIIERISVLNVNKLITDINAQLEILAKNV